MALRCLNLKLITNTLTIFRSLSTKVYQSKQSVEPVISTIICKNDWIWQQNTPMNLPKVPYNKQLPCDVFIKLPLLDPTRFISIIEEPIIESNISKEAAKLIVIRRHKMRKHKLKKLRKRLKFERAKIRQRRELKKEKAFQAELLAQIKEAEKFSAEEYVTEKIRQAKETPIPRFWKGKRLPEFIIREKLGLPPK